MRTLKRTLCLVMALVMMLGLCAINVTAAEYTDDDAIAADYREALEVLTGIGVFNGKDDGSLGPTDALQRVQGCYLICKMLGAPNGAGFASFSDVSAQDSAVVAYCQTLGIVEGYGDNTFHPYDPLTGAAFAKMCLVALGYNAAVESMTGFNWVSGTHHMTNVAALAEDISGYNPADTLTREQAAQMCFNTLKATMVEYQGNVSVTGADGLNVTVDGYRYIVENKSGTDYRYSGGQSGNYVDGSMQFVEMFFPQLRLDDTTDDVDSDNLNTPLKHIWMYRSSELYRTLSTPVMTYTAKINKSAVSADLSSYYLMNTNGEKMYITNAKEYGAGIETDKNAPLGVYVEVNGVKNATVNFYNNNGLSASVTGGQLKFEVSKKTLADLISDITANGRKVEFFANDTDNEPNRITNIVITCYTVAKIRTVSTNGNTTTYTFAAAQGGNTMSLPQPKTYSDAPADNSLITDAALARDDYVTLTYPGTNTAKIHAYATESFTGLQTSRSSNNSVVVDGTNYEVATGVSKDSETYDGTTLLTTAGNSTDFANSNSTGNFYMDQYGYLVHSDAVDNGNYAFIVNASGRVDNDVDGKTPVITARVVLSDGTVNTYKVATEKIKFDTVNNGTFYYASTPNTYGTSSGTMTRQTSASSDPDVYVIKNTRILVGAGDVIEYVNTTTDLEWSDSTDTTGAFKANPNSCAQVLMSSAYGYVYNYTVNAAGDTITLYPLENGYASGSYTGGKTYAGETVDQIKKSQPNYSSTGSSYTIRTPGGDKSAGGTTGHTLLIGASTPFVVYDSDNRTASVITGLNNMPANTGDSNYGYYAASNAVDDNSGSSLTAKTIFVAKGGGVVATTREYLYVSTSDYEVMDEDGTQVYYYRAWHEDGSSDAYYVKDKDDDKVARNIDDIYYSGLYTVNANDEISEVILIGDGTYPTGHAVKPEASHPYSYVTDTTSIENGMIRDKFGDWYYVDDAVYVYPEGDRDLDDANTRAYIVLEVSGADLTSNVKTIYVY